MSHNDEFAHLDNARQMEYRKKFQMVKQSLVSIGFSNEVSMNVVRSECIVVSSVMKDVQSIFTILAAILHVGDVSFVPHGSNDGVRVKNDSTIERSRKRRTAGEQDDERWFSCRSSTTVIDGLQFSASD